MNSQFDWAGPDRWVGAVQEFILLAMLTAAPWVFGAEEPAYQGVILAGVAVLTLLGGIRIVFSDRSVSWECPTSVALGFLLLLSAVQLLPLPSNTLRCLSPATHNTLKELLPDRTEACDAGLIGSATQSDDWRPMSLNPSGTRWFLTQLLALFLVAVTVRNDLASPGFYDRLRLAALVNGSALSLFALTQAASSPSNFVYWDISTDGRVFGPFICRNHFPFYVSLCIGLAIGLLSEDSQDLRRPKRRRSSSDYDKVDIISVLQSPTRLWILCGLVLMAVACVFSLSRGGIASMAISAIIVTLTCRRQVANRRAFILPIVGLALAAIFAAGLGVRSIEARFATLDRPEAGLGERLAIWRNVLPHLAQFPVFGSGNGTFAFMEPMYRNDGNGGDFYVAEYAHNEFLEAAFEGGVLRLCITLAFVVTLLVVLWRAVRDKSASRYRIALMGGLWAILTIAIHSIVDFGIHIPANALMATTVAAELTSLATTPRGIASNSINRRVRWGLALVATALAMLLAKEGVSVWLAAHYRHEAVALSKSRLESDRDRQIEYWETAVLWRPRDAQLQQSAGQAYLQRLSELEQQDVLRQEQFTSAIQNLLATSDPIAIAPNLLGALPVERVAPALISKHESDERRLRLHLAAAQHLCAARDLCPVLADAQFQLSEVVDCCESSDQPEAYLERAALLRPSEPAIWYALGARHREANRPEMAVRAWRKCLSLNDRFLPQILNDAHGFLTPEKVHSELLPERAQTWLTTAYILFPNKSSAEARRPFLEHALRLLEECQVKDSDLVHRIATLQMELQLEDQAEASFRLALQKAPKRLDWRIELVRLLRRNGRLGAALLELDIVRDQSPSNREADELYKVLSEEARLRSDGKMP